MTKHLHAKIGEVADEEFQSMVDELYHCVDWQRDDQSLTTAFYLFSAICVQDPKAMTAQHLPGVGVLTTRVDKLSQGVVYDLCRELVNLKRTHIEAFDGKTVLALIKSCFPKPPSPKSSRPRKPSRGEVRHDAMTRLIQQRRANGDL